MLLGFMADQGSHRPLEDNTRPTGFAAMAMAGHRCLRKVDASEPGLEAINTQGGSSKTSKEEPGRQIGASSFCDDCNIEFRD
jgi:hypothetical protein